MAKPKRGRHTKSSALSQRDRNKMAQMTRLVYCWRYIDHARAEAGEPIADHHHGYNMLSIANQEKIDATYTVASATLRHWQAIVVAYVRDGDQEYRSWAWAQTKQPIIAAGDGINPLLAYANDVALEGLEGNAACYARATIMAPWDAKHPIRPDRYAARLQSRLGLTKDDVLGIGEWEAPSVMHVPCSDIDLEIARTLKNDHL
tara:strand:- start:2654 stop:3262 length:609 start_codon:yes stop_codon:yes gene_type:complete